MLISTLLVLFASAASATKDRTVLKLGSELSTSQEADYSCETINLWTKDRHPKDYPNANAHWSPPVYVAHDGSYTMFKEGDVATAGVELVAETGGVSEIKRELESAGEAVKEYEISAGFGGALGDTSQPVEIKFDESHQYLSFIAMIAPSPDWVSGTYDYSMADDGKWIRELIVDTFPWDAGTDSGQTYSSSNADSNDMIFQITKKRLKRSKSTVFLSNNKQTVLPVARLHCVLDGFESSCNKEINDACSTNIDCCLDSGLTCQDSTCKPSLAEKQDCAIDTECASAKCRSKSGKSKSNKNKICK